MLGVGTFPGFLCAHRAADPFHSFPDSTELCKQRVRSAAIVVQMLLTRVGDPVELAGALGLDGGVPDFLKVGERGVHHAGTRYVETLGTFVQGLDDFIAMPRLFRQQPQYKELQIDGSQFSTHAEGSATHVAIHEPPAKVAKAATPMMSSKKMLCTAMHAISRYVVKPILRY